MTKGEAVNWLINITADIGKAEHRDLWHYEQALSEIREMLEELPIIEERKTGRWIDMDDHVMCSCCGATHYGADKNYCPNCGADMRGEADG